MLTTNQISIITIRSGIMSCSRKNGNFLVYFKNGSQQFTRLTQAVHFYNQLMDESSLWDITEKARLLEAKIETDG